MIANPYNPREPQGITPVGRWCGEHPIPGTLLALILGGLAVSGMAIEGAWEGAKEGAGETADFVRWIWKRPSVMGGER